MTVLNRGHKRPALTEGSRLCWALPSPVHERSGYRASRPTGYKVMRSFRIVAHGPVLASRHNYHRDPARCGRAIIAPSSSRSRPLTRRPRRWPSAILDRASPRRQRAPPTDDALLTTYSPYKVQRRQSGLPCAMVLTVSFVLSPVTGLFATVIQWSCLHRLDASIGASGPHDFAVRLGAVRQQHVSVHRIPPRVRDDREPPPLWDETKLDMR